MFSYKNNKRIVLFIFIFIIFLGSFSFYSKAEAAVYYCYATDSLDVNSSINCSTTKEECGLKRIQKIIQGLSFDKNFGITECKTSQKNPPEQKELEPFVKIEELVNQNKITVYWSEVLNIGGSGGSTIFKYYSTIPDCEKALSNTPAYAIKQKCVTGMAKKSVDPIKIDGEFETKIDINEYLNYKNTDTTYRPLAGIPGLEGAYDTTGDCPFGRYFNIMFKLFLGLAAVFAMIMIIMGGIEYMTSELVSSKQKGKERILNAVFGLILAFGAYAILNTINPDLLNACLGGRAEKIILIGPGPESNLPFTAIDKNTLQSAGITCPESGGVGALASISKSFQDKVTYSQDKRGKYDPSRQTIYLDCSSYAKQVYKCANLNLSGYNTSTMFPGADKITKIERTKVYTTKYPSGVELQAGDLLGWMIGESKNYPGSGHIIMYYGGGNAIEVHGPPEVFNKAVSLRNLPYKDDLKYLIKAGSSSSAGTTPQSSPSTQTIYNSLSFATQGDKELKVDLKNYSNKKIYKIWITEKGKADYIKIENIWKDEGDARNVRFIYKNDKEVSVYIELTRKQYRNLENKTANVSIWENGVGLGTKETKINSF
jgi:hypothetical protein